MYLNRTEPLRQRRGFSSWGTSLISPLHPLLAALPNGRCTCRRLPCLRGTIGRETDVPQNANSPCAEPLPVLSRTSPTRLRHAAPVTGNLVLQLGMKREKVSRLVNPSVSSRNGRWPPLLFVSL